MLIYVCVYIHNETTAEHFSENLSFDVVHSKNRTAVGAAQLHGFRCCRRGLEGAFSGSGDGLYLEVWVLTAQDVIEADGYRDVLGKCTCVSL